MLKNPIFVFAFLFCKLNTLLTFVWFLVYMHWILPEFIYISQSPYKNCIAAVHKYIYKTP